MDAVRRALDALARGEIVLVADDHDRENEVDAIQAARFATEKSIGWMVRHTSGYLCAPMPSARADALRLPPMVVANEDPRGTAYTVAVDSAQGVTTGISAADRAHTLRVLADPSSQPFDLRRPGHVLPLRAREGGVLTRAGHTEAAVDLVRLAGAGDVGVIGELVHDDGPMMRLDAARDLADAEGLELVTIADLVAWRRDHDATTLVVSGQKTPIAHIADADLPTQWGHFRVHAFRDLTSGKEHVVLTAPPPDPEAPALVRIHSECLTGDAFGSLRCDCGPQLHEAMRLVAEQGGAVVHVSGHEGRGIGLAEKIHAYALQDHGRDTVEANVDLGLPIDARDYSVAAAILHNLGIERVRLMTNNPDKVAAMRAAGIDVVERVPLEVGASPQNHAYLQTKKDAMGHLLHLDS